VISFEARQFRSAVSTTPELEQILFRAFQDEIDASLNWLVVLCHNKVRQRLAGLLIILLSKYHTQLKSLDNRQNTLSLTIPISRVDMSNLLGVRPESLSRAFHALEDDGLIEIIKHDHIKIVDVDGLMMEVGDPELFGSELEGDACSKAKW
jgi:CRP/FNR family transcriptional regulator